MRGSVNIEFSLDCSTFVQTRPRPRRFLHQSCDQTPFHAGIPLVSFHHVMEIVPRCGAFIIDKKAETPPVIAVIFLFHINDCALVPKRCPFNTHSSSVEPLTLWHHLWLGERLRLGLGLGLGLGRLCLVSKGFGVAAILRSVRRVARFVGYPLDG